MDILFQETVDKINSIVGDGVVQILFSDEPALVVGRTVVGRNLSGLELTTALTAMLALARTKA